MSRRFARRAFIRGLTALAGSGLLHVPLNSGAQPQNAPRRIGVLLAAWSPEGREAQAFRQGLAEAGYAVGRDVVIDWRWAGGDYSRVPELAAELVRSHVDVIVTDSTIGTRALQRITSTIPIVMASIADPLGAGFVASLAHPGGNITGNTTMIAEVSVSRLRLLKEAVPTVVRVAVLWNRDTPYTSKVNEALKAIAPSLSIELISMGIRTPEEIAPELEALGEVRAQALYVVGDAMFIANRANIVRLAAKARVPTIYGFRVYVDEGGLMSYGPNFPDLFRRSAGYVDKILKGARPGDLPIEQPNEFDLVINLKTAKALGLTIPDSILSQADEVIR
jgi:putative ABC transport system substrate-binding protein